jgi:hypothetical protein
MDLSPGTATTPFKGAYEGFRIRVRVAPPGRFQSRVSGSLFPAVLILILFPPVEKPFGEEPQMNLRKQDVMAKLS